MTVRVERNGPVTIVTLDRPEVRNAVEAAEALRMGLANRVSAPGVALPEAVALAEQLAALPQTCLRQDRLSVHEQHELDLPGALANEWAHGMTSLAADTRSGAGRFVAGAGRHGRRG